MLVITPRTAYNMSCKYNRGIIPGRFGLSYGGYAGLPTGALEPSLTGRRSAALKTANSPTGKSEKRTKDSAIKKRMGTSFINGFTKKFQPPASGKT